MNTSFETNWIKENIEALDCESLQLIQGGSRKDYKAGYAWGQGCKACCRYMDNF
ncbi:hypothetical protein [Bombilactobacillus thymidiniphilus]|uniref:Bacteriocin n=1 Tax=Bombilactobacillus thymidiniphilus TaxID=2923363 RepID=A0ABY4PCZ8_9LACO|nr:hypothetical protein [Bombilactobacillus thymidiniphilus]UQS83623.1 hypothetical protein MOO47_07620 [Bombilactobacillus thymidiniphilus]UQS83624.1 hypothetical protein MOO47_00010 [Bombilactobacillus thymidiniphilus]UQS83643.1 hypothetical protein MOO47_00105 [Bombilactobacillus thymidiniphilus]